MAPPPLVAPGSFEGKREQRAAAYLVAAGVDGVPGREHATPFATGRLRLAPSRAGLVRVGVFDDARASEEGVGLRSEGRVGLA